MLYLSEIQADMGTGKGWKSQNPAIPLDALEEA